MIILWMYLNCESCSIEGLTEKVCSVLRYPNLSPVLITKQTADKPVPNATLQVTGAVGWRREGLVYKKNEVVYSGYYCCSFFFCY